MSETSSLAKKISGGDRRALAKGITIVESTRSDHRDIAAGLLEELLPRTGGSMRLGISGAPGVGKSTFIESFGNHLIDLGRRVAVLAVDPTSALTGGSILGDKTRMQTFSMHENVFVRPSPASGSLGGVTRRTQESLLLCEAAGFDTLIIETVGVGQSEINVADMTDVFLLLLLPLAGDELQGIKRGITELADIILVNKADGEQSVLAEQTVNEYRAAMQYVKARYGAWQPVVESCSALEKRGIEQVWQHLLQMHSSMVASGEWEAHRAKQALAWMWQETSTLVVSDLENDPIVRRLVPALEDAVLSGAMPPTVAARRLVDQFKNRV